MNFKGKGCKNKGITLIALVITIIVLLILAGVTIMMLRGSENAPQKASEAVEKDAIAGAKDEVAMEAQSALLDYFNKKYVEGNGTDGTSTQLEVAKAAKKAVDSAKSKNKQLLSDSGVTDNTITLKTKSYTVTGTIDENGSITWGDIVASTEKNTETEVLTAEQIAQNPEKYYGKQVINYKANDEDTNVYRIFYVDEDNYFGDGEYTIYLKADPIKIEPKLFFTENFSDKTKMAQLNPAWKEAGGNIPDDTYNSTVGTAWLADPEVELWSKFVNKQNSFVNYSIGGPSIEMYMKSYNQSHASLINEKKIDELGFKIDCLKYVFMSNGKEVNLLPDESGELNTYQTINIDSLNFGGMYGAKSVDEWGMCSPVYQSDDDPDIQYLAYVYDSDIGNLWNQSGLEGISPVISIKSGFELTIEV